jgi:Uma2 family endonuclease
MSSPPRWLQQGDRLDQKTFHARYLMTPETFRAELIGGVVYLPPPVKRPHGRVHSRIGSWLWEYEAATPGTEAFSNTTNVLGPESEPQPDLCLLIAPEKGGQTRDEDEYIVGPPELVIEVAASSASIDLHQKKADYEQAGVCEYVVANLGAQHVSWFVRRDGVFVEQEPTSEGRLCSQVFPGLWLDPAALLRGDQDRVVEVLQVGLATAEHAAFVTQLAGRSPGSS